MHPVLSVDAQPDVVPITFYVDTPDEIDNKFDGTSYNKGACFQNDTYFFV